MFTLKKQARIEASTRRQKAHSEKAEWAERALAVRAAELFEHMDQTEPVLGIFAPIRDEISLWRLADAAHCAGYSLALPVVVAPETPLVFRSWALGEPLESGAFSVPTPSDSAQEVLPSCVCVPGLAFDEKGFRLGYGGGFYDRTLALWRNQGHPHLAVGVGFDEQYVPDVPTEATDRRLDGLLTPNALIWFESSD